jgi:transcriptional regulator with XRE-family HTH domain
MADLSRRLETPNATVARWVAGTRRPSPESCDRLADVLHADLDTILALAGHRPDLDAAPLTDEQAIAIALIRRADLSIEGRGRTLQLLLEDWITRDRQL